MSSEGQGSSAPQKPGGKDPCWQYGERVGSDTGKVRCKFCLQSFSGGISRFKAHLAGKRGNCKACDKVPEEVKKKVLAMLEDAEKKKDEKEIRLNTLLSDVHVGEEEDEENENPSLRTRSSSSSFKTKGPMDSFACRSPEETTTLLGKGKQPAIDSKHRKKAREDANKYIGKWFYEAGIPFNTATLPSFQQMVYAIGQFGPCMQAPSSYELREPILQREVNETKVMVENFKKNCAVNGCSILTDAWSDRKRRSLMNIIVHSNGGAVFLSSEDTSADKHDGNFILQFVEKAIIELGPENVVQIVTDGASNNMAASTSLEQTRPSIFWTTCAAHCVNLMLCDIARIKPIRSAILMGRTVSVYIYSHTKSLQLLREFTNGEILRPGATRFATSFLSLQSMRDKKREMRQMFISDKWMDCSLSSTGPGKKVAEIIASNKFWDKVDFALKVFTPLVKVLRRVDGDKIPSMGFVYGDLLVAKEELKAALGNEEKKYVPICKMVDNRWEDKLMEPLHKAGYYLNPYFFYASFAEIEKNGTFIQSVVECMHRFYGDNHDIFGRIGLQLPDYQHRKGSFGSSIAIKQAERPDSNPVTWWYLFGNDTPDLRRMAMRILSLTASSSACERNWSTFEMIHTKKRNRLSHKKLHDLVFVKFNAKLRHKHSDKNRESLLAYDDEERVTDWVIPPSQVGEESDDEVFPGEELTWTLAGKVSGANPKRRKSARMKAYQRRKKSGASSSRSNEPVVDEEQEWETTSESSSGSDEACTFTDDISALNPDED